MLEETATPTKSLAWDDPVACRKMIAPVFERMVPFIEGYPSMWFARP